MDNLIEIVRQFTYTHPYLVTNVTGTIALMGLVFVICRILRIRSIDFQVKVIRDR